MVDAFVFEELPKRAYTVEELRVANRPKSVNAQAARLLARRSEDVKQRFCHGALVNGTRVKSRKDEQFHFISPLGCWIIERRRTPGRVGIPSKSILKGAPMMPSRSVRGLALLVVAIALAGCGATRSSPDNPLGAGGLTPSVEDKDAGLVAVAPGFDVKGYATIGVALFPVTDKLEDEGDRRFAAKMAAFLRTELVRRLRESGLFQRVVEVNETGYRPGPGERVLKLEGAITRLGRGSQAARYFAGIYGAGRTRAQADIRFVEAPSGKVVLVTADRRVASIGFFGGDDEDHLRESFDDMARDLAKFLVRLSKGEAPKKD